MLIKILFYCFSFFISLNSNEESLIKNVPLKPLLRSYQSKLTEFCASAVQSFGAQENITGQQVLDRLQNKKETTLLLGLHFDTLETFLDWAKQQEQSVVILYDQNQVRSAVALEYAEYLASIHLGFNWYCIDYVSFAPLLLEIQQEVSCEIESFETIPYGLFIINGQIWQIPDIEAMKNFKYWIDLFVGV